MYFSRSEAGVIFSMKIPRKAYFNKNTRVDFFLAIDMISYEMFLFLYETNLVSNYFLFMKRSVWKSFNFFALLVLFYLFLKSFILLILLVFTLCFLLFYFILLVKSFILLV